MSEALITLYTNFIRATIKKQLKIAKRVKDLQNHRYYIYCKNFDAISTKRIGDFRVEVNKYGDMGILCEGAQQFFSYDDYIKFLVDVEYSTDGSSVWI